MFRIPSIDIFRWVEGNLPLDSVCDVCDEAAGVGFGLRDLRCIWCQSTVHHECQEKKSEQCDYGQHRRLIIPPEKVVSKQKRTVSAPRRKIISQILPSETEEDAGSRPVIVVGNNKSGNSDSAAILASFRRHLNPGQVINLGESNMEEALEWCSLTKPRKCIIVACGGDGTIRYSFSLDLVLFSTVLL